MAAEARTHVDAINYNVNVGNAGSGVTVAFLEDGMDRNHPALRNPGPTAPLAVSDPAAESVSHGSLVALLIGGLITKDVYGIAYESDLEFVCCDSYDDDILDFIDRQSDAGEYLAQTSRAFVVNLQNDGDVDRVVISGGAITSFDDPVTDTAVLNAFHKVCVAPDTGVERLCVISTGDGGFHDDGVMQGGVVELLLTPSGGLSLLDRQALERRLYRHSGIVGGALQDGRFEGHALVVAALKNRNSLADFTSGCGDAKFHCLSALGIIPFEVCPVTASNLDGICAGTTPSTAEATSNRGFRDAYFAAPLVSGAAAVLKSTYPSLDAPTVSTILLTTAVDIGDPGVDDDFGWGRLDLGRALMSAGAQRSSAGTRLADTRIKAGSSMDAALATSTASFGMFDMHDRPYLHFVSSRMSSSQLDPALSLEDWQHSSAALMEMSLDARMGLSGSQRGTALTGMLGLAVFPGWDMGLEQCHLSCPSRRDVQVGSLVESSALAWTQRQVQVAGGRMGLVLETGLEEGGGMTYTNRGLFAEARPDFGLLRIEAGMLDEKATFMGSEFSGALDVRPGDSHYISASLGVPIGENAFSAGYTLGKAKSGLVTNSYVTEIDDVSYDAYRLAFGGERWELGYTVPLAATKGGMRVESISGYTGSEGDWSIVETDEGIVVLGEASAEDWSYRTDSHWIDLGAGARERRLGLTMARPYGNWEMTFAVEHVANSPRKSFAGDEARAAVVLSLNM